MTSEEAAAGEAFAGLLKAGFTAEELRSIAAEIQFAATVAGGMEESVRVQAFRDVEWTPEKRAAWNEAVGRFLGRAKGSQ